MKNYKTNNSNLQSLFDESKKKIGSITVLDQNQQNHETLNYNKIITISNNQNIGHENMIYIKKVKDKDVNLNKSINVNNNPIKTDIDKPNYKQITISTNILKKNKDIYIKKNDKINMKNMSTKNKEKYNLLQMYSELNYNNSKDNSTLNKINKNTMEFNKSNHKKEFYQKDNDIDNIDNIEQINNDNMKKMINNLKVMINDKKK